MTDLIAELAEELARITKDRDRLRRILDSRPAINAGLPETYIAWSHGIYQSDFNAISGASVQ